MTKKYDGRFLRVRNLDKYQHYGKRRPPWIKLHVEILSDYDFRQLPDAIKWQGLAIMLLASQEGNHLPDDPRWIAEVTGSKSRINVDALLSASFLEVCDECERCASKMLATCYQDATLETETETETETEPHMSVRGNGHDPQRPDIAAQIKAVWESHLDAHRLYYESKNGRAPATRNLTPQVKKLIRAAIKSHGFEKAEDAGRGIFLSDFHTGKNDEGKEYLGSHLPWRINAQGDNVERFSEIVETLRSERDRR